MDTIYDELKTVIFTKGGFEDMKYIIDKDIYSIEFKLCQSENLAKSRINLFRMFVLTSSTTQTHQTKKPPKGGFFVFPQKEGKEVWRIRATL